MKRSSSVATTYERLGLSKLYRALVLLIASATEKELARYVCYLQAENQMLRIRLPARVLLTSKEKARLVRRAAKLGRALDCLATIVLPDIIRRWAREARDKRIATQTLTVKSLGRCSKRPRQNLVTQTLSGERGRIEPRNRRPTAKN